MPFLLGLPGGFVFDDYPVLLEADAVRLTTLTLPGLVDAAFAYDPAGGLPRPLVNASFALNHWLSGLDPAAFKLTNIALHALNGLLLFALVRRLLQTLGLGARADFAAVAVAVVWLVHPLQVSTVLYIVQRMEMAYATFLLVAAWAYVAFRIRLLASGNLSWPLALTSLAAAALAWTAKENAAVIPYLLLAIELIVFRCRAAHPHQARALRLLTVAGVAIGALALIALYGYGVANSERFIARDFGPIERLASQAVIVPFYLGLIIAPRPDAMLFYYDHWALRDWTGGEVAAGIALIVLLLAVAWRQRNSRPLVSLGIVWFFAGHLVTSAPLPLELAFEHRNYVPSAGVVIAMLGVVLPLLDRAAPALRLAIPLALAALVAVTGLRSAYWADIDLMSRYKVDINPTSMRARMDYGERYMLAANRDPASPLTAEAIAQFEQVTRLPQGSILGEHALVLLAAGFGMPAESWWWTSMERKVASNILRPQDAEALIGLVEQRLEGLPLDDRALLRITLAAARRDSLSAEVLLLFATHAASVPEAGDATLELLARGRRQAASDREYLDRIDRGIHAMGGDDLLHLVRQAQARLEQNHRGSTP
ncbi:MAG TPA: hypothetical protein DCM32_01885 [Xanthomonadaceae bacterium]|nr:hypothetical protein [Xanthomonadaceae bacterium]